MADYRLYCLDGAGHIGLADWFEAKDDTEAISKARQMTPHAHSFEVWRKGQLVARISSYGHLERAEP